MSAPKNWKKIILILLFSNQRRWSKSLIEISAKKLNRFMTYSMTFEAVMEWGQDHRNSLRGLRAAERLMYGRALYDSWHYEAAEHCWVSRDQVRFPLMAYFRRPRWWRPRPAQNWPRRSPRPWKVGGVGGYGLWLARRSRGRGWPGWKGGRPWYQWGSDCSREIHGLTFLQQEWDQVELATRVGHRVSFRTF